MSLPPLTVPSPFDLATLNRKLARIEALALSDLATSDGALLIPPARRVPSRPRDGVLIYVDPVDGELKIMKSDGVVRKVNTTP